MSPNVQENVCKNDNVCLVPCEGRMDRSVLLFLVISNLSYVLLFALELLPFIFVLLVRSLLHVLWMLLLCRFEPFISWMLTIICLSLVYNASRSVVRRTSNKASMPLFSYWSQDHINSYSPVEAASWLITAQSKHCYFPWQYSFLQYSKRCMGKSGLQPTACRVYHHQRIVKKCFCKHF